MTTLILLGVYLTVLIPLAWLGHRKAKRKTPHDFYLAGGSLGFLVLLCTLFATQYSGNTFMAFPAKAYRLGYAYVMSVGFMMAMVGFYCTYAPALRRRAVAHGFVTPGDWIHQRYQSTPFTILCAVLMIVAVLNYLLAQLMAMGHAMTELTGGMVGYTGGVLFLAFVVVIYESLGGMRAVVWTDTLQGLMMGVAVVILGVYLLGQPGLLAALPSRIMDVAPAKVQPPGLGTCTTWLSTIFLVGLGGAMYPQGIQRIFAAKSSRTLRRSLAVMVFIPLFLVFFALLMGVMGIVEHPGLGRIESDRVMVLMLTDFAERGPWLSLAVSLLLVGALAAIMSTADSVLLSISSILVQDVYGKTLGRNSSPERLLRLGKISSWVFMGIVVAIALTPRLTLFRLLEIKFEFLIQIAPAFILGIYRPRLTWKIACTGVVAGCVIALIGFLQDTKWYGWHPGIIGCAVNLIICLVGEKMSGGNRTSSP